MSAAGPVKMDALASYMSIISDYIPAAVKETAGLCPQISEDVRHITWHSIERVFWPPHDTMRFVLVLGYTDGFQIWDLQDHTVVHEILSKQDKAVVQAKLLPVPLTPGGVETQEFPPLGISAAPLLAYLHRGAPTLVRLFSLKANDDVHLLRLTEPAKCLQASRRFFAVGFTRQVELYDALNFNTLFSVQCNAAAGPAFALGHRWLAYNLPPQQPANTAAGLAATGLLVGGPRQVPSMVWDGLQYLGQVGQRTLDHMLMPQEGMEQAAAPAATRGGVVAIRDATTRAVIAQCEDHTEPVEAMAWDPSGLQLVTCAALGHRVLVHRALLGAEHALVMHDSAEGGLSLGSIVFQHLYTLSRGYTPAVISDIVVSDDGQLVAVSSAKGTTHVFRLPPLHSAALGHRLMETGAVRLTPTQPCASSPPSELGIGLSLGGGNAAPRPVNLSVCTRVKQGSVLLQEGLMPKCGFLSVAQPSASSKRGSQSRDAYPRMYISTRAGTLALYALSPGPPSSASASSSSSKGVEGLLLPGTSGASVAGTGGVGGATSANEGGEWQAVLTKEIHTCRPFRHFSERRLSAVDLGMAAPSMPSTSLASPRLGPHSSPQASPELAPQASPRRSSSPRSMSAVRSSSPRPMSAMRSSSPGPMCAVRSSSPGPMRATTEDPAGGSGSPEHSKWLSSVEIATHVPMEVPLWLCPQLSFHAYPASIPLGEINASLRAGQSIAGRKKIAVSRPERPGDGVRYDGNVSFPGGEERLSRVFGGSLGAAPSSPPAVAIAPAWGAIAGQFLEGNVENSSLEQVDGIGSSFEEVEEDWLKA